MRIVLQRVQRASVTVEGEVKGAIRQGLLLLVGVGPEDQVEDITYCARKILHMRIFSDEAGKMNRSLLDVGGEILSISQFTLFASTKKGNRPSYTGAAAPERARQLYEKLNQVLSDSVSVQTGVFGADMQIDLLNDGPVTILLDSKARE